VCAFLLFRHTLFREVVCVRVHDHPGTKRDALSGDAADSLLLLFNH